MVILQKVHHVFDQYSKLTRCGVRLVEARPSVTNRAWQVTCQRCLQTLESQRVTRSARRSFRTRAADVRHEHGNDGDQVELAANGFPDREQLAEPAGRREVSIANR